MTDKALEATGFAQTSMEQVYSWDPDILFLDGPGLQPCARTMCFPATWMALTSPR